LRVASNLPVMQLADGNKGIQVMLPKAHL